MELISGGVCDVVWDSEMKSKAMVFFKSSSDRINPLRKFNDEIHDMILELDNMKEAVRLREIEKIRGHMPADQSLSNSRLVVDGNMQVSQSVPSHGLFDESRRAGLEILLGGRGFRVQRLVKGDALTVRALAGTDEYAKKKLAEKAGMYIVAVSTTVSTFSLTRESIKYLPDKLRMAFERHAMEHLDYDMSVKDIDWAGFTAWQKRKIAYYEEFLTKRKEYIDHRNNTPEESLQESFSQL